MTQVDLQMPSGGQAVASPHAHGGNSVRRTMLQVQVALVPATLFGFWLYGWPAFFLWAGTILSCIAWEALSLRLAGSARVRPTLLDGSAVLTGWLLAMTLPPWAPWRVALVGGFIAIVIGKQVFGGIGQNVFNPAMVARVALLVSFPVSLTQWVTPMPLSAVAGPDFVDGLRIFLSDLPMPDAISSASLLGHVKTELSRGVDMAAALGGAHAPASSWLGVRPGSLGESSAGLILVGGLFMIGTGLIGWHLPLAMLAGLAIPAAIASSVDPTRYLGAAQHLLSGAAMLGAFFIVTDYVTSPNTRSGQLLFAFCVGLLTWVIRTYGGYPEGMAFAVLLMNAMTPVIDRFFKPRILGRDRRGKALDLPDSERG